MLLCPTVCCVDANRVAVQYCSGFCRCALPCSCRCHCTVIRLLTCPRQAFHSKSRQWRPISRRQCCVCNIVVSHIYSAKQQVTFHSLVLLCVWCLGLLPDDFFVATLSCHGKLWRLATCVLDFKVSKAIRLGVNKVFAEMPTHIERERTRTWLVGREVTELNQQRRVLTLTLQGSDPIFIGTRLALQRCTGLSHHLRHPDSSHGTL